jgi:hypothetical protein
MAISVGLAIFVDAEILSLTPNNDDVYLKKITTSVSQNLILHKNSDQSKA